MIEELSIYHILTLGLAAYVSYLVLSACKRRTGQAGVLPAVGSWFPWLGLDTAVSIYRDPAAFLRQAKCQYGPAYTITLFGAHVAIVNHPVSLGGLERQTKSIDDRSLIEMAASAASGLSDTKRLVDVMLGRLNPLIIEKLSSHEVTGARHKEAFDEILDGALASVLAELGKERVPMFEFISRTMYRTSSRLFFGSTYPLDTYDDFRTTFRSISLLTSPLAAWMSPWLPGRRARDRLVRKFVEYIAPCWDADVDIELELVGAHELITESVRAMKESGLTMTEAAGIFVAFLFGIHSNSWFHLYHMLGPLLSSPTWQKAIEEETRRGAVVSDMKLLESAMHEGIRRPLRFLQLRRTVEDVEVKVAGTRYYIPKDTWILPKTMHHDPAYYADPFVFKPDRFLESGVPKPRGFGDGHRVCKGKELAKFELVNFVATLFQKYDLQLVDAQGRPQIRDISVPPAKPDSIVFLLPKLPTHEELFLNIRPR